MGATQAEFHALVRDGVLVPRTLIPSVKSPSRIGDALDLLAEFESRAIRIAADDDDWESIQASSQRSRRPVGDLVEAIRDGKITLGQVPAEASEGRGYHAFRLRRTEVDALAESILPAQPSDPIPGAMSRPSSHALSDYGTGRSSLP